MIETRTTAVNFLHRVSRRLKAGWYAGATASVVFYSPQTFIAISDGHVDGLGKVFTYAMAAVFFVVYMFGVPLTWPRDATPDKGRRPLSLYTLMAVLVALNLALVPALHAEVIYAWPFLVVVAATYSAPLRARLVMIGVIVAAGGVIALLSHGADRTLYMQFVWALATIGLVMLAFSRQIETTRQLRATQHALAEAAVLAERGRMSRDLHDILGHSLTVISIKAELAGRLLEAKPAAVASELADIERLSRAALADVRATVSGSHTITLSGELVHARQALDSGGIEADLPTAVDAIEPAWQEVLGFVVREGVTNVLRHSGARRCRIRLGKNHVEVEDDGTADRQTAWTGQGTGLDGLAERLRAVGGTLTTGRSPDLGGFALTATIPSGTLAALTGTQAS